MHSSSSSPFSLRLARGLSLVCTGHGAALCRSASRAPGHQARGRASPGTDTASALCAPRKGFWVTLSGTLWHLTLLSVTCESAPGVRLSPGVTTYPEARGPECGQPAALHAWAVWPACRPHGYGLRDTKVVPLMVQSLSSQNPTRRLRMVFCLFCFFFLLVPVKNGRLTLFLIKWTLIFNTFLYE